MKEVSRPSEEKTMPKVFAKVIGILALSLAFGSTAFAWTPIAKTGIGGRHMEDSVMNTAAAPEIDPAAALSGLTLLLGGLAVVRGSRSKK
jgi:hypothetical protein